MNGRIYVTVIAYIFWSLNMCQRFMQMILFNLSNTVSSKVTHTEVFQAGIVDW